MNEKKVVTIKFINFINHQCFAAFLFIFYFFFTIPRIQKGRFFNVLINSRPIFLYSRITDMWKSGESSISRRKQKEKSQCQRLPNRERGLAWKTPVSKAENEGWMNIETGRTKATTSPPKIFTQARICSHVRNIQKEGNRWICMENWWQTVWKKPGLNQK